MNTKDLQEKRNKLLSDAQQILLNAKDDITSEQRSSVNKMLADVDILESDIEASKRIDAFQSEHRSNNSIPRSIDSSSIRLTSEDRSKTAFEAFIRNQPNVNLDSATRSRFAEVETRDLITSSTGTNFVPQAFYPELFEAQKAWGDIFNLVNVVNTETGAPLKYATSNDAASVMYEETEGTADSNSAEDPVLSGALISSIGLSCPAILVSWAELQDSAFSIDGFVKNILGERYYRSLSSMIVNGSTSGTVGSILAGVANASPVTSAANTTVTYTDIASLYGSLDPAYEQNASFAMNSTTRATLLGEVDTLGRPLFLNSPVAGAGAFETLLGRPVKIIQALPNISANAYPILYGDFKKGYTFRVVNPGLSVVVLKERYADLFCTGYIPYVRGGGAFIGGINNPLKGLKVHA